MTQKKKGPEQEIKTERKKHRKLHNDSRRTNNENLTNVRFTKRLIAHALCHFAISAIVISKFSAVSRCSFATVVGARVFRTSARVQKW